MNLKKKNKSLEQKYTTDRYVEAKDSSKCNTFITWLRQIQFHATIAQQTAGDMFQASHCQLGPEDTISLVFRARDVFT